MVAKGRMVTSIKFHENPSSETDLFHVDGRAYRQEAVNTRFSQLYEGAKQSDREHCELPHRYCTVRAHHAQTKHCHSSALFPNLVVLQK